MATLFLAIYLKLLIQKTPSVLITRTIPLPPPVVKCFARGHFGESIIVTSLILKVLHHSFGIRVTISFSLKLELDISETHYILKPNLFYAIWYFKPCGVIACVFNGCIEIGLGLKCLNWCDWSRKAHLGMVGITKGRLKWK